MGDEPRLQRIELKPKGEEDKQDGGDDGVDYIDYIGITTLKLDR
jgi:hypothetical protein